MFERWGRFVARARWAVLAAGLALVVLGVTWGTGVFGALSAGGFSDPHTGSNRVRHEITQRLGPQDYDVLVLYSSLDRTVDDPAFRAAVAGALDRVRRRPEVTAVVSVLTAPAPTLVSADRHATYALIRLGGDGDDAKIKQYRAVEDLLVAGDGVTTQFGGVQPFLADADDISARDIQRAETLSTPVLLVLLVLIFGSVVAGPWPSPASPSPWRWPACCSSPSRSSSPWGTAGWRRSRWPCSRP